MRLKIAFFAFVLGTGLASAQGTFIYDQQSSSLADGTIGLDQTPFGQSFTPTLDSIGFVELYLSDGNNASTVAVNIRSDSISGPILGTSLPVTVPSVSGGIYDFLFSNPITLTPGIKYYFEPLVVSGGFAVTDLTAIQYTGGDAIWNGVSQTNWDLRFGEGVISSVPEPSAAALFVLAGGALCCQRRKRRAK